MSNSSELPQQYPSASAFEPVPKESTGGVKRTEGKLIPAEKTEDSPSTTVYPSVSSATVSLPRQEAPRGGSTSIRSSLRAFVRSPQTQTQPVRGVERLAQKQFSTRAKNWQHRQRIREKEEAHQILNFVLRLAETMFHCGADTIDVDSAVVSVCSAFGLDDIEVDITSQSIIINYVSDVDVVNDQTSAIDISALQKGDSVSEENDRIAYTVMRVVRSWSENYAGLEDIYRLIGDITQRKLSLSRAERRLSRLIHARKPYSPLVLTLANFLTAASLTLAFGGAWIDSLLSGLTFSLIYQVNRTITRLHVPLFFNMLAGSSLVTLVGLYLADERSFLAHWDVNVQAQYIVAAGLIILLPTSHMIATVQDALTGFPLTAAGKFIESGLSLLGIGIGLSAAVGALHIFDMGNLYIDETVFHPPNTWKNYVFMLVASVCIGIIYLARRRALAWIIVISTCGIWVTNFLVAALGEGTGRASAVIGALVVGMLSTYLAYRLQAPATMFYVPSLTFLLPGLFLFRGLFLLSNPANENSGFLSIMAAATIIFGMAAGVVLGNFLMQYLMQKLAKSESLETVPMTSLMSVIKKP